MFSLAQGPVVTDNGNLILDWKFQPSPVSNTHRTWLVVSLWLLVRFFKILDPKHTCTDTHTFSHIHTYKHNTYDVVEYAVCIKHTHCFLPEKKTSRDTIK